MAPYSSRNDERGKFVNTVYFEGMMSRAIQYMKAGYPVHFIGPSGVGKTSLAIEVAKQLKRPISIIRGNHELSNRDLLGDYLGIVKKEIIDNYIHSVYKKEEEIKPQWVSGQLVEAIKDGHVVIYDEFTRSRPETNNIFLSLIEERVLPIYGKGNKSFIRSHPDFSIIFTSNPAEYSGTFHTQDALMDRLITINLELCDKESEINILRGKIGLNLMEAEEVVRFISNFRSNGNRYSPSLRASLMIGTIAKKNNINIDPQDKQYQQLCFDILYRTVKEIHPDLDVKSIQELIIQEMTRKGESK